MAPVVRSLRSIMHELPHVLYKDLNMLLAAVPWHIVIHGACIAQVCWVMMVVSKASDGLTVSSAS